MTPNEELLMAIFKYGKIVTRFDNDDLPPIMAFPTEKYLDVLKAYKDYQPMSAEEQFLSEAFNRDSKELVDLVMHFPPYKHLLAQKALFAVLNGWKIVDEAKVSNHYRRMALEYTTIEVDYGLTENSIKEGTIVLESIDNQRLAVKFYFVEHMEEGKPRSDIYLICEKENKQWLDELVDKINKWIEKNNYLKGKKIKPDLTFLDNKMKYNWDDLIVSDEVKEEIQRNIKDYFELGEIYRKNNLPFKRGMICYGQPGTGKTLLGKVLASQIESTFIWVTPSDVETAKSVEYVFEMARDLSPTILFFEDLDLYASIREGNNKSDVLGELLAQMDGFMDNNHLFIIATTNDLKVIEPALKDRPSRFDSVIAFKPMDENLRTRMIRRLLRGYITKEEPDTLSSEAAKLLKNMTGAELNEFFISVIKTAIDEKNFDADKKVILSLDIFKKALNKIGVNKNKIMIGFGS